MKLLGFDNVTFSYTEGNKIIDDLSFVVENENSNGFLTALIGASGAGKTTMLKLLLRTLKPDSGRIVYNTDNPIISYVPQEAVLFEHLSPLENARYFSNTKFYKDLFDEKLFSQLCESMDMAKVLRESKSVNDLSGGQKQRILLLRALSVKPDFLMMDEPSTGLDSSVKLQFLNQLREIVISQNIIGIYVTHHRLEAEFIADEIAFIRQNGNGINKVYMAPVRSFIEAPPLLDAVEIFNYPTPNILKCNRIVNGKISLSDNSNFDNYIVVPPESVKVSSAKGLPFRIRSSNPVFSQIEIEGQLLTVNTTAQLMADNMKVSFTGNLLCYNENKVLRETLSVEQNEITSEPIATGP